MSKPYSPPPALRWNQLACEALFLTRTGPTVAARALCIIHTAMYDAWSLFSPGKERSTTTGDMYQRRDDPKWHTASNRKAAYSFAAYRTVTCDAIYSNPLPDAFKAKVRNYMVKDLVLDPDDTNQSTDNPVGIGNLSARLVLECREGDKSNQANRFEDWTCYQTVNQPPPVRTKDINHWQPQLVAKKPQKFLTPHWCQVTPFALSKADQFRPPAPVTKEKFAEFKALGDTVSEYSAKLTETQKIVAEYWAGIHEDRHLDVPYDPASKYWTTPSAQCCRIAGDIAVKLEYGANAVVPLFFVLGSALLDASIACWDAKRYYDYVRPITMIAELRDEEKFASWGGPCRGTLEMEGEGWCPYLELTPPFAEYVSGHSCFSATTAEILRCFTGSNEYGGSVTIPAKGSRIEPDCIPSCDITLSWPTLDDMAKGPYGVGISRIYGGIHFMPGNVEGARLGENVAKCVWERACRYLNGTI